MLFADAPFARRFGRARMAGFAAVECRFPYAHPAAELGAAGLEMTEINAPPGDWTAGGRGLAARPGGEAEFGVGLERALGYAVTLGAPRIHVLPGVTQALDRAAWLRSMRLAAARAAAGIAISVGR
ncbi:hypothetical protein [Poseidonocella sp. HB161398]|uniref:hypothetical protein n=1 Tax=Poseidonocella sp. HB161398 TaxID=2320855 RepID=UPI001109C1A4|nr:hypothetical protein [Poseidonocella sp. HB161398]